MFHLNLRDSRPLTADIVPRFVQLAALCWRMTKTGPEVLLVSSSTGRWILPKGWPMNGKTGAETALTEAWEEAGVRRGKPSRKPVGEYMAIKRTVQGDDVPCLHRVYAIKVRKLANDFPEAHRRDRLWLPPAAAAARVDEDGLRELLLGFSDALPK